MSVWFPRSYSRDLVFGIDILGAAYDLTKKQLQGRQLRLALVKRVSNEIWIQLTYVEHYSALIGG